jgi:SLT domain-containing protein
LNDPLMLRAVAALSRGHALFVGGDDGHGLEAPTYATVDGIQQTARNLPPGPARRSQTTVERLQRVAETDDGLAVLLKRARAEHAHGHTATRHNLEAAIADVMPAADTPTGRRDAMARMAGRLRTQHGHVVRSRTQARLLAQRLRRLRYPHANPTRPVRGGNGHAAVVAAIRKALNIKGIHNPVVRARWERGMDLVARRESNYDANAVNRWDSNAASGTPSRGAWQFIGPTFAAYHEPGTPSSIHDLVAQACAFINYARGHYGVAADASNLADRIQQADPRRAPRGY